MSRETRLEGKTFDQRYRIDEYVGSGGMSDVYRAHDLQLGVAVALKILKPSLAADEQQRQRFINEARTVAGIRHAHIVLIYGFGVDQGLYYIAMEFLEGEPLDGYLRRRGPLPLDESVEIVKAVASALDAAHRKDVIHRDVKPANVIRSPHGHITLTDFGLVREQAKTRFTRSGTVMGTPQYMSPEQIKTPLDVDHRTDVYALGHLAYELLTGAPAIDENLSEYNIYEKQINHTFPAPSSVVTGLGPAIDEVVAGALAKDRDDRYESAGEFAAALAEAAYAIEDEIPPPPPPPPGLLLILLATAALLMGWFYYHSVEQRRSSAATATAEAIEARRGTDEAIAAATNAAEAVTATARAATSIAANERATAEVGRQTAVAADARATQNADEAIATAAASDLHRRETQAAAEQRAAEATEEARRAAAANYAHRRETQAAAEQRDAEATEEARRVAVALEPVVRFYAKDNRTTLARDDNCTMIIWQTVSGNPTDMQLTRLARPWKDVPLSGSEDDHCFVGPQESKMEFRLRYLKPGGEQVTLAVDVVRGD